MAADVWAAIYLDLRGGDLLRSATAIESRSWNFQSPHRRL